MRAVLAVVMTIFFSACHSATPMIEMETENELKANKDLLEFALSRDAQTTILDTDPTSAQHFWEERDREIDAVLGYVSNGVFDQPSDQLEAMVSIDQSLRHLYTAFDHKHSHFDSAQELELAKSGLGERLSRVDEFNTDQLKKMLQARGWFRDDIDGPKAAFYGWLLAQHADMNPDFQREALAMMEAELGSPGVSKKEFAYLFDRVAEKDGRPQRYGTQGKCTAPEVWEPNEMEDPENVDARRADVQLPPMIDYIAGFKNICVGAD